MRKTMTNCPICTYPEAMTPETTPELNVCNEFKYPSYDYVSNESMKFDMKLDAEYGE